MSEPLEELEVFLDELDAARVERVVVRWVDETRPIAEGDSGVTVGRVTSVTVTAAVDGEVARRSFEGIGHDELRRLVDSYPFEVLYRSDNLTR